MTSLFDLFLSVYIHLYNNCIYIYIYISLNILILCSLGYKYKAFNLLHFLEKSGNKSCKRINKILKLL